MVGAVYTRVCARVFDCVAQFNNASNLAQWHAVHALQRDRAQRARAFEPIVVKTINSETGLMGFGASASTRDDGWMDGWTVGCGPVASAWAGSLWGSVAGMRLIFFLSV